MRRLIIITASVLGSFMLGASALAAYSSYYGGGHYYDVPTGHWAYRAVQWAFENGVMSGPSNKPGAFDPEGRVTRAQLATVSDRIYARLIAKIESLERRIDDLEDDDDDHDEDNDDDNDDDEEYEAFLDSDQETKYVDSDGEGEGTFTLSGDDLSYRIEIDDLEGSITGAHFHRGRMGVDGPILESIDFDDDDDVVTGVWRNMTDSAIEDLEDGDLYVNVHTTRYPDGEIRGQIEER